MVDTVALKPTTERCACSSHATGTESNERKVMSKLEVGQRWYNQLHSQQPVDIIQINEQMIMLKTETGFIYTYDYWQFLNEYKQTVGERSK